MKTIATVVAIAALVMTVAVMGSTEETGPRAGHGQGFARGGGPGGQMDPAERWAKMLEHADTDKDGKISKDEFRGPDAIFDRLDGNTDGFITEDEAAAMGQGRRGQRGQMDPANRWAKMLEHADADKDGKISKEEFRGPDAAFDRLDANGDGFITEDEANAAADRMREGHGQQGLARMDTDGDGNVSREEWNAAFDKLDTNGDGVLNKEDRPERGACNGEGQGAGRGQRGGHGAGQGRVPNA